MSDEIEAVDAVVADEVVADTEMVEGDTNEEVMPEVAVEPGE